MAKPEGFNGFEEYPELYKSLSVDAKKDAEREILLLQDGRSLYLSDDRDLVRYVRAKLYVDVTEDGDRINSAIHKVFLRNAKKEGKRKVKDIKTKSRATVLMETKLSETLKKRLFLYMEIAGEYNTLDADEISIALYEAMDKNPEKVIYFFENSDSIESRLNCLEMVHDGIIKKTKDGYLFNGEHVSQSLEGLVARYNEDKGLRSKMNSSFKEIKTFDGNKFQDMKSKTEDRETFLKKKYEYLKEFGEEYVGNEDLVSINSAWSEQVNLREGKSKKLAIEEAKREFRDKWTAEGKTAANIAQSCRVSKNPICPINEWESFKDDFDKMYEYLYNKTFSN